MARVKPTRLKQLIDEITELHKQLEAVHGELVAEIQRCLAGTGREGGLRDERRG